ncbi:MAG: hypothetical protein KCHDKBKB_02100 [Elusimicrobia bacterium]|nr:hypothetical protein [Elusimicrobiota bacterium]
MMAPLMAIDNVFEAVSHDFGKGKIPCVIIGGLAVNFYQYNRQTTDVDFLICKEDFARACDGLKKLGYKLVHQQENFAQFETNKKGLMDVDLMFVDKETLGEILKDAQEIIIRGNIFLVPSLWNLIALKLHSSKGSKFRELKDLLDVVLLAKMNNVDVHGEKFRDFCLKYGNDDLYRKVVEHSPK